MSHNGIEATLKLAKLNLFWPGMSNQILDKVKRCNICAKINNNQCKQELQSHEIPEYPFEYVSMDVFYIEINEKQKKLNKSRSLFRVF